MKRQFTFLCFFVLVLLSFATNNAVSAQNSDSLSSAFTIQEYGCVQQHINIVYTGNAPASAVYTWDFGGAVILSGSGQGPYWVKWETDGMKSLSLTVTWDTQTSTTEQWITLQLHPIVFAITGGGSYPTGGVGVEVGLSGSESGIPYKLRLNGVYTGLFVYGNGSPISFGLQTEPGTYSALADGFACDWEMEGTAIVSIADTLTSTFNLQENGCVQQHINIAFTGSAPAAATFTWDFGGAVILSGSGQGPYWVKWETAGMKTVSLTVTWESHTSTTIHQIHVQPHPLVFVMTGGGSYPAGGNGVEVGLSGSEIGILYRLRRLNNDTVTIVTGTGSAISFGFQTVPDTYSAIASGPACDWEMEGTAIVSIHPLPYQKICMVTFDTSELKNKIIWNKMEGLHLSHFNIYKETFQDEHYEKIAEVPYTNLSVYVDQNSAPLVKTDKYKITVSDSLGFESEKSPYHKTVHLNINAGIYGFNLIWNHYEGFEFLSYHIYRKFGTGPYELIAALASNIDSYTDFYMEPGITTYYIEVVRPEPCTPSLKDQVYNSVVSNTATAAPLGIEDNSRTGIIIYPNPVKNKVFIVMDAGFGNLSRIELYRPSGQLLLSRELTEARSEVDLSNLVPGVYFIRISSEHSTVVRKIIKE